MLRDHMVPFCLYLARPASKCWGIKRCVYDWKHVLVFDERLLVLHVLRLTDGQDWICNKTAGRFHKLIGQFRQLELQRFTSERLSVLVNCENILKTLCVPLLIQSTVR